MINKYNLFRHARFLLNRDAQLKNSKFDMREFSNGDLSRNRKEICGTVACSMGEVVLWASKEYLNEAFALSVDIESFYHYLGRIVFGELPGNTWQYFFGYEWVLIDNTRKGAAKRILYYLAGHDIVDDYATNYVPHDIATLIEQARVEVFYDE